MSTRKVLVITLAGIGITLFIIKYLTWQHLVSVSPTSANPLTGQLYPLNDHGDIFYVTKGENMLQDITFYGATFLCVVAGLLNFYWKALRSPIDDLPKKFY